MYHIQYQAKNPFIRVGSGGWTGSAGLVAVTVRKDRKESGPLGRLAG